MANHKSAEKRARQIEKRTERNRATKSRVRTAIRGLKDAKSDKEKDEALKSTFSSLQKARGVLHRNNVRRKMARAAKASAK